MVNVNIDRFSKIETDPFRAFRFRAEFSASNGSVFNDNIVGFTGGFQTIDGLAINIQNIPYREGGFNTTTHQMPGMATFEDVTFSRGVIAGNDEAITWMRGLFTATAGEGLALKKGTKVSDFRCNVKIYVMDHPNTSSTNNPSYGVVLRNAWIKSLRFSGLDAGSNSIFYETMTLVHEGLGVFYSGTNGKPVDTTLKFEGVGL
jgi:phage tail-like protein